MHFGSTTWLRQHSLNLVLSVAFLFTASVVFEQGRTIEAQKTLIRALFSDSLQLHAIEQKLRQAPPAEKSAR